MHVNLERLIINDFKSYKGLHDISFDRFTCISGANGSGKSNILDSFMFCFGFSLAKIRYFEIEGSPSVQCCFRCDSEMICVISKRYEFLLSTNFRVSRDRKVGSSESMFISKDRASLKSKERGKPSFPYTAEDSPKDSPSNPASELQQTSVGSINTVLSPKDSPSNPASELQQTSVGSTDTLISPNKSLPTEDLVSVRLKRVFFKGVSVYSINEVPCTKTVYLDVVTLLGIDTAKFLVQQGEIETLSLKKPLVMLDYIEKTIGSNILIPHILTSEQAVLSFKEQVTSRNSVLQVLKNELKFSLDKLKCFYDKLIRNSEIVCHNLSSSFKSKLALVNNLYRLSLKIMSLKVSFKKSIAFNKRSKCDISRLEKQSVVLKSSVDSLERDIVSLFQKKLVIEREILNLEKFVEKLLNSIKSLFLLVSRRKESNSLILKEIEASKEELERNLESLNVLERERSFLVKDLKCVRFSVDSIDLKGVSLVDCLDMFSIDGWALSYEVSICDLLRSIESPTAALSLKFSEINESDTPRVPTANQFYSNNRFESDPSRLGLNDRLHLNNDTPLDISNNRMDLNNDTPLDSNNDRLNPNSEQLNPSDRKIAFVNNNRMDLNDAPLFLIDRNSAESNSSVNSLTNTDWLLIVDIFSQFYDEVKTFFSAQLNSDFTKLASDGAIKNLLVFSRMFTAIDQFLTPFDNLISCMLSEIEASSLKHQVVMKEMSIVSLERDKCLSEIFNCLYPRGISSATLNGPNPNYTVGCNGDESNPNPNPNLSALIESNPNPNNLNNPNPKSNNLNKYPNNDSNNANINNSINDALYPLIQQYLSLSISLTSSLNPLSKTLSRTIKATKDQQSSEKLSVITNLLRNVPGFIGRVGDFLSTKKCFERAIVSCSSFFLNNYIVSDSKSAESCIDKIKHIGRVGFVCLDRIDKLVSGSNLQWVHKHSQGNKGNNGISDKCDRSKGNKGNNGISDKSDRSTGNNGISDKCDKCDKCDRSTGNNGISDKCDKCVKCDGSKGHIISEFNPNSNNHLSDQPLNQPHMNSNFREYAISLVDFDSRFSKLFYFIFKETVVAYDLSLAKRIAFDSCRSRVVTLNGELIEKSGLMSGKQHVLNKGLLRVSDCESDRHNLPDHMRVKNEIHALVAHLTENNKYENNKCKNENKCENKYENKCENKYENKYENNNLNISSKDTKPCTLPYSIQPIEVLVDRLLCFNDIDTPSLDDYVSLQNTVNEAVQTLSDNSHKLKHLNSLLIKNNQRMSLFLKESQCIKKDILSQSNSIYEIRSNFLDSIKEIKDLSVSGLLRNVFDIKYLPLLTLQTDENNLNKNNSNKNNINENNSNKNNINENNSVDNNSVNSNLNETNSANNNLKMYSINGPLFSRFEVLRDELINLTGKVINNSKHTPSNNPNPSCLHPSYSPLCFLFPLRDLLRFPSLSLLSNDLLNNKLEMLQRNESVDVQHRLFEFDSLNDRINSMKMRNVTLSTKLTGLKVEELGSMEKELKDKMALFIETKYVTAKYNLDNNKESRNEDTNNDGDDVHDLNNTPGIRSIDLREDLLRIFPYDLIQTTNPNILAQTANPNPNILAQTANPNPNISAQTTNPNPNILAQTTNPSPSRDAFYPNPSLIQTTNPVYLKSDLLNKKLTLIQSKHSKAENSHSEIKKSLKNIQELICNKKKEFESSYQKEIEINEEIQSNKMSLSHLKSEIKNCEKMIDKFNKESEEIILIINENDLQCENIENNFNIENNDNNVNNNLNDLNIENNDNNNINNGDLNIENIDDNDQIENDGTKPSGSSFVDVKKFKEEFAQRITKIRNSMADQLETIENKYQQILKQMTQNSNTTINEANEVGGHNSKDNTEQNTEHDTECNTECNYDSKHISNPKHNSEHNYNSKLDSNCILNHIPDCISNTVPDFEVFKKDSYTPSYKPTEKLDTLILQDHNTKRHELLKETTKYTTFHKAYELESYKLNNLRKKRNDLFNTGLKQINKHLKNIYEKITRGGQAILDLVEADLTGGIILSIKPPQKTWKELGMLSGGEKTIASVALVLAIHEYRPSPFYLLDEIDAALDYKNTCIIAQYLRKTIQDSNKSESKGDDTKGDNSNYQSVVMAKRTIQDNGTGNTGEDQEENFCYEDVGAQKKTTTVSQFIVVSHRKGFIEQADTIIGVYKGETSRTVVFKIPAIKKLIRRSKMY